MLENKDRDGFFEFYGITEEEEELFKVLYRRRLRFIWTIVIMVLVIAALIVLLYLT